jgi:predicted Zn-dependent protease
MGRSTEAMQQFRLAVQQKPGFDNARFNLAHSLAKTGNRTSAIDEIRMILKKNPADSAALRYLDQLTKAEGPASPQSR